MFLRSLYFSFLFLSCCAQCTAPPKQNEFGILGTPCSSETSSDRSINGALLASRINSIEELKSFIDIFYFIDTIPSKGSAEEDSEVLLRHCSHGREVISELHSGISQDDIADARDGDYGDQLALILSAPYAVANRMDLNKVYTLARWKPQLFGEGDVAFYDLARTSVNNINTLDLAYKNERDSSEKGYINSFNHITGQAFVTSCFSEEMADYIADVHELHNMPELTTGKFTDEQLKDVDNNPVDNYVDMINNEWGQELGKQLKKKHGITRETLWTKELMVSYLNDIQSYYSWAFGIGISPFRINDDVVIKFADKINQVMRSELEIEAIK